MDNQEKMYRYAQACSDMTKHELRRGSFAIFAVMTALVGASGVRSHTEFAIGCFAVGVLMFLAVVRSTIKRNAAETEMKLLSKSIADEE